jgi:hypothetical protein
MILSRAPALQPPLPPMAAVGGSGVVRARVAALNAATGAGESRPRPANTWKCRGY